MIEKESVLKNAFEQGCEEKRRLEDEYKELFEKYQEIREKYEQQLGKYG